MRLRSGFLAAAGVCLTVLAACGSIPVTPVSNATNGQYDVSGLQNHMSGNLNGDDALFTFGRGAPKDDGSGGGGTGLGVNAYLWRGALETLSFMPLASADPFGGVIITDWYQPPAATGERFKATAYILGRQLRADGVRVTVFRQVQQGGVWVDAPVAGNTATDIENKVLARARELSIQSARSSS